MQKRIAIVEDDPAIRYLLNYYLHSSFDLEMVDTFDAGLEAATQQDFDVFLFDINLGEVRTGIDLLDLLRKRPACEATPAIVCSAFISTLNEQKYLQQGFDACIPKPFTEAKLQEVIGDVLERYASPKARRMAA